MNELASLDATAQADLVRSGEASPSELVDAAIGRIEALNPQLNAVIHPLFDKAREAAAGDLPDGPFRGVPMMLKDLAAHSAGDPFHEGLKFAKEMGWTESEDTVLVQRFRRAGFVICGKTNTPELGILPTTEPHAHGPTRNPWDTDRSPGGSSGGSAASVAAGLVPVAHANDGGGSIRIPASFCGLVGLKPSRGRTSLGPEFGDMMAGLVNEHVVARSVRDTAAILDAVHGPEAGEPYVAPPPSRPFLDEVGAIRSRPPQLRIGIRTDPPGRQFETHPDCVAAAEDVGKLLESLGHSVEPAELPGFDDPGLVEHFLVRWFAGTAWALGWWERRIGRAVTADDVEPLTWAIAEQGRSFTAPQLFTALEMHQRLSREMAQWHESGFDLLLTPTCGEPPTRIGEYDGPPENPLHGIIRATPIATFTAGINMTGQPAISLPLHWNGEGLPIGAQLVAPYGREDVLLRVAAQLEEARPWADRRPPVFAGEVAAA